MKFKRKICLLVAFVLLFANLLMPAVYASKDEVTQWDVSTDGKTLFRYGEKLDLYQSSREFYLDPRTVYVYENTVDMTFNGDSSSCYVYASSEDAEFVWVKGNSHNYLYASNAGMAELNAFLNGTAVKYTLENNGMNADIANSEIQGLDDAARQPLGAISVDVRTLENQQRYDVVARDATYTLAYVHGAIYYIDNQYYYLNYETLGNNYFDANGNFSYRSGTVPLTAVDAMAASVISQTTENLEKYTVEYTYEDDVNYSDDYDVIFWILFVIVGFLAPIPLLVLGIVLPIARKKKDGKRWYSLAVLAGLWLLLAAILALILII